MNNLKSTFDIYFKKYEGFLKVFSVTFLMRSGVIIINLGTGVLMRRELGEADSGLFGLIIGALAIFNIGLNFGFNSSAIYFAKKKPEKLHLFLTTNIIVTGLSIIIILLLLYFFSFFFNFQSNKLRIIFIICYTVYSFSLIYRSFLLGMDENLFMQRLDLISRVVYAAFILILFYFKLMSVLGIIIFLTIEYFVFAIIAHRKSQVKIWPLQWDTSFFKENVLFNSKSYIAGILSMLLLRADQFVIKAFYSNHQVGVYSIGGTIIESMFMVTAIITAIYLPKLLEKENYLEIIDNSKKVLIGICSLNIGLSVIIYILSPILYELYFSKPNIEGANSLRILLIGFVTYSVFMFNFYIYFSVRLKKSLLIILSIGLFLNLLLNYLYLPKYGILASAWASSFCYTLVAVLSCIDLFYIKRKNFIKKTLQLDEERS